MCDARYLRTQSVNAEAQVVSELDPIFAIIEEDRLAEEAWDEELSKKEAASLHPLATCARSAQSDHPHDHRRNPRVGKLRGGGCPHERVRRGR